jgi:hypothetical protein
MGQYPGFSFSKIFWVSQKTEVNMEENAKRENGGGTWLWNATRHLLKWKTPHAMTALSIKVGTKY